MAQPSDRQARRKRCARSALTSISAPGRSPNSQLTIRVRTSRSRTEARSATNGTSGKRTRYAIAAASSESAERPYANAAARPLRRPPGGPVGQAGAGGREPGGDPLGSFPSSPPRSNPAFQGAETLVEIPRATGRGSVYREEWIPARLWAGRGYRVRKGGGPCQMRLRCPLLRWSRFPIGCRSSGDERAGGRLPAAL